MDVETGNCADYRSKPDGVWVERSRRETDTLDGYACSSWYFLRYLDPHNDNEAWNHKGRGQPLDAG